MKQVILHIGMHKTGTTTLQHALFGYSSRGVKYASFSEENHSIPIYTIFSARRCDYHIWRRRGFTQSQVEGKRKKYLEVLEKDLKDKSCNRLIISGEDISLLSPDEQSSLIHWLRGRGVDIKVLALVRSPISFASSAAQELIKNRSKVLPVVNPDYRRRLEVFRQLLPQDAVVVDSYDEIMSADRFISFFKKQMGVNIPEPKKMNRSMSLQAICLVLALNNVHAEIDGTDEKVLARNDILTSVFSIFSIENGCDSIGSKLGQSVVCENAGQEALWLFDNFGIDFRDHCSPATSSPGAANDFKKPLHDHHEKLRTLFDLYKAEYREDVDLSSQLLDLYVAVLLKRSIASAVNQIRDVALKIQRDPNGIELNDALSLMKVAGNLRPQGPLIHQKIREWAKKC